LKDNNWSIRFKLFHGTFSSKTNYLLSNGNETIKEISGPNTFLSYCLNLKTFFVCNAATSGLKLLHVEDLTCNMSDRIRIIQRHPTKYLLSNLYFKLKNFLEKLKDWDKVTKIIDNLPTFLEIASFEKAFFVCFQCSTVSVNIFGL
jgi:hypothetical protein